MVTTIVSSSDYWVTVDAFDSEGDVVFSCRIENQTVTQAADYAIHAINYFKFAMLDHSDWTAVQVEINSPLMVVEVFEIKA